MKSVHILLDSMGKVQKFVSDMGDVEGEACIYCGRCSADAKSMIGILSLDLSKPLELQIQDWKEEYSTLVGKYLAVQNENLYQ